MTQVNLTRPETIQETIARAFSEEVSVSVPTTSIVEFAAQIEIFGFNDFDLINDFSMNPDYTFVTNFTHPVHGVYQLTGSFIDGGYQFAKL